MPKIIENLEQRLIAEAKHLAETSGYGAVTTRAVATGCHVGVGTVYNYFSSKEDLLAAYLLSEWEQRVVAIQQCAESAESPEHLLRFMHDQLIQYGTHYYEILGTIDALSILTCTLNQYHILLRSHLSQALRRFCSSDFSADFIAEALLTWTIHGVPFDQIYTSLEKLL